MRKIKFRGVCVEKREFIYGTGITDFLNMKPKDAGVWLWSEYCWKEVFPETVGQYTGLKDKNGVEIYENDIVNIMDNITFITYKNGAFVFGSKHFINCVGFSDHSFTKELLEMTEVIGNIHHNPELVESMDE